MAKELNKAKTGKVYVYSTMSTDVDYCFYNMHANPEDTRPVQLKHKVRIKGGTGVIKSNFETPHGVVTIISEDDFDLLETPGTNANRVWNIHKASGGIMVVKGKEAELTSVVRDMSPKDKGAQLTKSYFDKPINGIDVKPNLKVS